MRSIRATNGFTLIELLIVVSILGVIASIAAPNLFRARLSGNEASAIGSLSAINGGQSAYAASCGSGAFVTDLADLVKPATGTNQGFISPDLKSNGVAKSGYTVTLAADKAVGVVTMTPTTCNAAAGTLSSSYFANADPVTVNGTGTRYFATDSRRTIFYSAAAVANPIVVTTAVQ